MTKGCSSNESRDEQEDQMDARSGDSRGSHRRNGALDLVERCFAARTCRASAIGHRLRHRCRGNATFALLPRPRIKFENVTFSAPDAVVSLQTGMIKGDLRLLPLLTGCLELSSITLFSPYISVDLDKSVPIAGAVAAGTKPGARSGSGRLGEARDHLDRLGDGASRQRRTRPPDRAPKHQCHARLA